MIVVSSGEHQHERIHHPVQKERGWIDQNGDQQDLRDSQVLIPCSQA
jgi:hypothetical protein